MDSSFYGLLGQVGATVVSIVFSFFTVYLLYLKEQRDRIQTKIAQTRRKISSEVVQLSEMREPYAIISSLSSKPEEKEEQDKLGITKWIAQPSWEFGAGRKRLSEVEVWKEVIKELQNLVEGILPYNRHIPEVESESFSDWEKDFMKKTEHIEWMFHGEHSWARRLIERMVEWERKHPLRFLSSQDVALLLDRIMILRSLIYENGFLQENYENLTPEKAISHYRTTFGGLLAMSVFSIVIPLLMLLYPPVEGDYDIPLISFLGFIFSTILTISALTKSARK